MSELGFGHALYYPYIHLQDDKWVKTAALYYESLSRIVPEHFVTHDSDTVKRLNDSDEKKFIINVSPGYEAEDIAENFIKFARSELSSKKHRKPILDRIANKIPSKSGFRIHMEKMGTLLEQELPKLGLAKRLSLKQEKDGEWYDFEPLTGALYMTHLANRMAEIRGLPIVTDDSTYQPLIRGIQFDHYSDSSDRGHALASLVIETSVPEKIENIPVKKNC